MRLNVSVVSHVLKKVSSSIGLWDPAFAQDKKLCAISLSGVSMLLINIVNVDTANKFKKCFNDSS